MITVQTISESLEKVIKDTRYREFDLQNEESLSVVQKNTARRRIMIEKLIDTAKIENRSLIPNWVSVEINQEVKDMAKGFRYVLVSTANKN